MRIKAPCISALGSVAVLCFILLLKQARAVTTLPPSTTPPKQRDADLQLEQLLFEETDKGILLWQLQAEQADLYQGEDLAFLRHIDFTFYGEKGNIWYITGQRGTINTKTMHMTIVGNVQVDSKQGMTLTTDQLNWNNKTRLVYTERPVKIIKEGHLITGVGLEFFIEQEAFIIKHQVRSEIKLDKKRSGESK